MFMMFWFYYLFFTNSGFTLARGSLIIIISEIMFVRENERWDIFRYFVQEYIVFDSLSLRITSTSKSSKFVFIKENGGIG